MDGAFQDSILELKNVSQIFPENGVHACSRINLSILRGEILGIMGENGAGKSTLMFLISGFLEGTEGTMTSGSGRDSASRRGLTGMVHQKPILAGNLTVLENIIMDSGRGYFRKDRMVSEVSKVQQRYGLPLDLKLRASSLSAPQIQRCELIRALWKRKEMIILDEPTASLSPSQSDELFRLIFRLKEEGKTVLFISHKIHEVTRLADRIAVLRQGRLQGIWKKGDFTPSLLSRQMIGENEDSGLSYNKRSPRPYSENEPPVLSLSGIELSELGSRRLQNISFRLFPGEILGIGGIRENGLSFIEDLLSGIIQPDAGTILINGENRMPLSPLRLRRSGISYIPADRLSRGADPESSLAANLTVLRRQSGRGSYRKRLLRWAETFIQEHSIRGRAEQQVKTLSGGNIQKMIVARELDNSPPLLIVSEPSWGLDFKSRQRLHTRLIKAGEEGIAVLLLTTDLDELLSLSDRACILTEGILTEIKRDETQWNRNYIGEIMTGADRA